MPKRKQKKHTGASRTAKRPRPKRTESEIYEILKEQNWRGLGEEAAINRAIRDGTAIYSHQPRKKGS